MPRMTAAQAITLLDLFEAHGLRVWVDGGWGVDALLGRQTREHDDLDVVLEERDLPELLKVLRREGFRVLNRDYRPWNFVLAHLDGREVDLHVVVFDADGDGIYGPLEAGEKYPAASLTGTGSIGGREVICISPEWQWRFHTGYEWDDADRADMRLLCRQFGFDMPDDPTIPRWKENSPGP